MPVSAPPTPARRALKLHWPGETGPPCAQRPHGPAPFGSHIPHRKQTSAHAARPLQGQGCQDELPAPLGGPAGDADGSWAPLRPATLAGARTHNWQHFGRCAGLTGLVRSLRPAPVYSPLTKHREAVRRLPLAQVRRAPAGRLADMGSFDLHLRGSVSLVTAQGHLVRNSQRLSLCGYCTVPPGLGVQDCDNIPIPGSPALTKGALASELGRQKDANPNRSAFLKAPELRPGAGNTWAQLSTLPALASGLGDIPPFSPHSGLRGGEPQPGLLDDRMAPQPTPA